MIVNPDDILYRKYLGKNAMNESVYGVVYLYKGSAIANQEFYREDGVVEFCPIPIGRFSKYEDAVREIDNFSIDI